MRRQLPAQPRRLNRLDTETLNENLLESPRPRALESRLAAAVSGDQNAGIISGPIIGLTTDTTSRVVIAIDRPCTCVQMRLVPKGEFEEFFAHLPDQEFDRVYECWKPTPWSTVENAEAWVPLSFTFCNLIPEVRYHIECNLPIVGTAMSSGVRTLRTSEDRFADDCIAVAVTNGTPTSHVNSLPPPVDEFTRQMKANSTGRVLSNVPWVTLQNKVLDEDIDLLLHTGNIVDTTMKRPEYFAPRICDAIGHNDYDFAPTLWNYARALRTSSGDAFEDIVIAECHKYWCYVLSDPVVRNTMANCPNVLYTNETEIGRMRAADSPNVNEFNPIHLDSVGEDQIASSFLVCAREWCSAINGLPNRSASMTSAHKLGPLGVVNVDLKIWPWLAPSQCELGDGAAIDLNVIPQSLETLFSSCSALLVVLQEPISSYDSLWTLSKYSRDYLIRELLIWRDSRSLGEREVVLVSGTASNESAGIHDIVDLTYLSPISLMLRANHLHTEPGADTWAEPLKPSILCRKQWFELPFAFTPRNRLREIVVPSVNEQTTSGNKPSRRSQQGTSRAWCDNKIRCYNYSDYTQSGFAVLNFGADLIPFKATLGVENGSERRVMVSPTRATPRNPALSDTVKFWSTFYMEDWDPVDKIKRIARTRSVSNYEFVPGYEAHATGDQTWLPLPDDPWSESFADEQPDLTVTSRVYHAMCKASERNVATFMAGFHHWINLVSDAEHFYKDYRAYANIQILRDDEGNLMLGPTTSTSLRAPTPQPPPDGYMRWANVPVPPLHDTATNLLARLTMYQKALEADSPKRQSLSHRLPTPPVCSPSSVMSGESSYRAARSPCLPRSILGNPLKSWIEARATASTADRSQSSPHSASASKAGPKYLDVDKPRFFSHFVERFKVEHHF